MAMKPKPIEDRFWPKVDRRGPDECWPWKAARLPQGYGFMGAGRRGSGKVRAHRLAWVLANGRPIPEGLEVRHRCDNPPCVNPAHLLVGTSKQNAEDKIERGRQSKGEKHGGHKLTAMDVADIRARRAAGQRVSDIARRYGVARGTVERIYYRKLWVS